MSALSREHARELARWLICGALVLGAHGAVAAVLASWSDKAPAGGPQSTVFLDLSPILTAPTMGKSDAALEPQPPEPQPPEPPPPEPQLEPPPPPQNAEVTLPPPPKPAPPPKPKKITVLSPRLDDADKIAPNWASPQLGARGDLMAGYKQLIVGHLTRHKIYPEASRVRAEEGTVVLSFTINRLGHVVSSQITRGSGHPTLDREALDMLKRAQPFPTPPVDLPGQQFPFSAPMRYDLR
jgi:protein TonB